MAKRTKTVKAKVAPESARAAARLTQVDASTNKQTSPITVGGGSVSIDFNHVHYAYSEGRFSKVNDEIDTLWVYDKDGSLKWDLRDFVFGKDCSVTIHTKVGSNVRDVVIRSRPQGPLSIEFAVGEFPLASASNRLHFNPTRAIIDHIEVIDNADNSKATFSVPTGGVCRIQIVNLH